jgi:hypothetical protein
MVGTPRYHEHRRKFGFFMTLLSLTAVFILTIFFLLSYFEKSEVSVIFYTQEKKFGAYMDLREKPFFWRLFDSAEEKMVDPRLLTTTTLFWDVNFSQDGWFNVDTLQTQNCSTVSYLNSPKYQNMLIGQDLSQYSCVKENSVNLSLTNDENKGLLTQFNIYIVPCTNTTENNNHCHPQEKIENYLSTANIYFQYILPSVSIDHLNITYPVQESFKFYNNKIYPNMYYSYITYFKTINYTNDRGTIMYK